MFQNKWQYILYFVKVLIKMKKKEKKKGEMLSAFVLIKPMAIKQSLALSLEDVVCHVPSQRGSPRCSLPHIAPHQWFLSFTQRHKCCRSCWRGGRRLQLIKRQELESWVMLSQQSSESSDYLSSESFVFEGSWREKSLQVPKISLFWGALRHPVPSCMGTALLQALSRSACGLF